MCRAQGPHGRFCASDTLCCVMMIACGWSFFFFLPYCVCLGEQYVRVLSSAHQAAFIKLCVGLRRCMWRR